MCILKIVTEEMPEEDSIQIVPYMTAWSSRCQISAVQERVRCTVVRLSC